jgi:hypothetical protein
MNMKHCRTVNGLIKSIQKGQFAVLKVWDIMTNYFDEGGAYLNLGEGRYAYVGKENWQKIRNYIVNPKGEYYKNLPSYSRFFA